MQEQAPNHPPAPRINNLEAQRTRAIVVGIEQHDEVAFNRPGVASHACNLTAWLIDCGVRPDRIHLFLSPTTFEVPSRLTEARISVLAPTRDGFDKFVTGTLRNWDDVSTLLLFWIGHGLLDDDNDRRLIFSDTTAKAIRSMSVSALWKAFRAPNFPQIDHLVAFIDACAQPVAELTQSRLSQGLSFDADPLYAGGRRPRFVIYSTSEGERSRHAPPGGDRLSFADLLHDVLTSTAIPPWPLRAWTLFERLRIAATKVGLKQTVTLSIEGWLFPDDAPLGIRGHLLPEAGTASRARVDALAEVLKSIQPYLVVDGLKELGNALDPFVSPDTSSDYLVAHVAAYSLEPPRARLHRLAEVLPDFLDDSSDRDHVPEQLNAFYNWLDREFPRPVPWRESEILKRELTRARDVALPVFREAVRSFHDDHFEMLRHGRDPLDTAVDRLVDQGGTSERSPVILQALRNLIERLKDQPLLAGTQNRLKEWIARASGGAAVPAAEAAQVPGTPRLSFTIQTVGTRGQIAIDAWLEERRDESPPMALPIGLTRGIGRQQLRRSVLDALRGVRTRLGPQDHALRVEFFVSLDTMDLPFESVPIPIADLEERALGAQYPVVMRSFDRSFRPKGLDLDGQVEEKWTSRWGRRPQTANGIGREDVIDVADVSDVHEAVRRIQGQTGAAVGLDGVERPEVLQAAVAEGFPVLVWSSAADNPTDYLPSILGAHLDTLPERIRELRDRGADRLRLIYDPPKSALSAAVAGGFTQPEESDGLDI